MSTAESQPSPSVAATAAGPLPAIDSPLAVEEVLSRLGALAKRGKLAGFARSASPDLFEVSAFGPPFDYRLIAAAERAPSGTRLRFRIALMKKLPIIFALVVIVSIWPGVWLTDSMLRTYFSWYTMSFWGTCAWYMPLTVLPLPWMWKKMVVGSRAAANADARELIGKIAGAIEGRVTS